MNSLDELQLDSLTRTILVLYAYVKASIYIEDGVKKIVFSNKKKASVACSQLN
ncbi:hypothetical protein SH1V18_29860 [Vallitalea longa]|uniref:Uncharacterized protein n=1 Tax=Vallitalea longa TaxID=2936439 RepID=A0A9W5YDA9_9FIRM|nr:hypothetical protein [Vallitalea longa]GKX30506.1 hypothetical protein SH1V18_29860 [Vallitalea longa]